jgi:hypothetical protein
MKVALLSKINFGHPKWLAVILKKNIKVSFGNGEKCKQKLILNIQNGLLSFKKKES